MCGFRRSVARRISRLDLEKWPNRMSPLGPGCVKTPTSNLHVEILSRLRLNRKRTARAATVEGGQGSKQFCALCSPTFSHSLGQKQTSSREAPMSAVPLNSDIQQGDGYVRLCAISRH